MACTVLLTCITVIDVIGRYLLNSPLMGATKLTELLLTAVIFLGLPAVSLDDAHICVDILLSRVPRLLEPLCGFLVNLVSAGVLGVVSWQLWKRGIDLSGYGQSTNTLHISIAPLAWFAAIAVAAAAIVTVVNSFMALGLPRRRAVL
ncbi:TRAP transporter small permease [Breoghania sp.]|uniref:TRAP transporter small permease n=1 Tax=Breoghania sp. TaxID=2065378 RepID=UPI0026360989|nr:TRAP transporter small permease [Breoghania sp.]MDJ0933104.1 TRAP transporter small permease [Breoghania sp.]